MRILLLLAAAAAAASCLTTPVANTHQQPDSARMAASIMSRRQGVKEPDSDPVRGLLEAGVTQKAFTALLAVGTQTGAFQGKFTRASVQQYVVDSAESVVHFVANGTYEAFNYPLDRLSNGNALLSLALGQGALGQSAPVTKTQANRFRDAAKALKQSIDLNPRTSANGLWYYVYPYWSYLDGMYSLPPFLTYYALEMLSGNATAAALDDVQLQVELLWEHTRNETTGLLVHGYDDSKTAVWANPETGASPHVWGRSLGWFTMSLVDTIEILDSISCNNNSDLLTAAKTRLQSYLLGRWQSLATSLLNYVDPKTGAWYQIVDRAGAPGNYIESSGSSMFAYSLLKGARLGHFPESMAKTARKTGLRAQKYLTEAFVDSFNNGTVGWNGTVAVCSLNSTASYDYYVRQPILYNSILGEGAYVLASVEAEIAHPA